MPALVLVAAGCAVVASGCALDFSGYHQGNRNSGASGGSGTGGTSSGGTSSGGTSSGGTSSGGASSGGASSGGTSGGGTSGGGTSSGGTSSGGTSSGGSGSVQVTPMVDIDGLFKIDIHEVTNAQYLAFLKAGGPAKSKASEPYFCSTNSSRPSASGPPNDPVEEADWCDAYEYCHFVGKRLCGKIGGGATPYASFADPATSEWMYACSHNGQKAYAYGSSFVSGNCNVGPCATTNQWCDSTAVMSLKSCVGGYPGLYDMIGNVAEWVNSCDAANGGSDHCRLRGGSRVSDGNARCDTDQSLVRVAPNAPGTGIRCCKN